MITMTCTASGYTREADPTTELLVVMRTGYSELPNALQGSDVRGHIGPDNMTAYDFLLEFQAGAERDMLNRGRTPRAMLGHCRKWYVYEPSMDTYWATTVGATGETDPVDAR